MTWDKVKFHSLFAEPSRNGVYKSKEHHGTGVKIINMGELFAHDRIGQQEMARLQLTEQELTKSAVLNGDLLFGRRSLIEEGAGRCALAWSIDEPTTFESSIIRVRLDNKVANPVFYFYYFRSPVGRARIRAIVNGATVKGIRGSDLQQIDVDLPSIDVQSQIASKLSLFDEMIETNRRRIALLEESARRLYREWFVNLRFPGNDSVKWIDGLPEGWLSGYASEWVNVLSGGTPNTKTERFWTGDIPFFTPKDCTGSMFVLRTEKTITEDGLQACNSRLFAKQTIFITARGTVGKVVLAQKPMAMNQSCYALTPKAGIDNLFLFLAIEDGVEHLKAMASGGVFDTIVVDTFKRMPFICPKPEITHNFGKIAEPIFSQIENLMMQNVALNSARDELLPKLMSGAIQV